MGMITQIILYCDGGAECPLEGQDALSGGEYYSKKKDYKLVAEKNGWVFNKKGNKAYCPACTAARSAETK